MGFIVAFFVNRPFEDIYNLDMSQIEKWDWYSCRRWSPPSLTELANRNKWKTQFPEVKGTVFCKIYFFELRIMLKCSFRLATSN